MAWRGTQGEGKWAWESWDTVSHTDLTCSPSIADLTHMIHILDTEHPWEVHSVNSGHSEAITCLEWDQSGDATKFTLIPEP